MFSIALKTDPDLTTGTLIVPTAILAEATFGSQKNCI